MIFPHIYFSYLVSVAFCDDYIFMYFAGKILLKLKFPTLMIIMCGILHGILLDIFFAGEQNFAAQCIVLCLLVFSLRLFLVLLGQGFRLLFHIYAFLLIVYCVVYLSSFLLIVINEIDGEINLNEKKWKECY